MLLMWPADSGSWGTDTGRITGGGWRGSDVSSIVPPITRTQPAAHSWLLAGIIGGVMTELLLELEKGTSEGS